MKMVKVQSCWSFKTKVMNRGEIMDMNDLQYFYKLLSFCQHCIIQVPIVLNTTPIKLSSNDATSLITHIYMAQTYTYTIPIQNNVRDGTAGHKNINHSKPELQKMSSELHALLSSADLIFYFAYNTFVTPIYC